MTERSKSDEKGELDELAESIEEVEQRLTKQIDTISDQTDKRLATTEKRIDDIKWFLGGIATLFTVGFSVITLVFSWNYNNERTSLREFKGELKADISKTEGELKAAIGKTEILPDLVLQTVDGEDLSGKQVNAQVWEDNDNKGKYLLVIPHIKRNKAAGATGPLYMKIYTKNPLILDNRSTDERNFEFEAYFQPQDFSPAELPGGFTVESFARFGLRDGIRPPPGEYVVLLKVFYGKGKIVQSIFTIVLPKDG